MFVIATPIGWVVLSVVTDVVFFVGVVLFVVVVVVVVIIVRG